MNTIPVIDVSRLAASDVRQKQKIAETLGRTAHEIGFFQIKNHGIPQEHIDAVYNQAKRFFKLSKEEKMQYYIAKNPTHRGYVPFTEKGDYPDENGRNYEAFDLGMELPNISTKAYNQTRLLGSNVWPNLPGFQETVYGYYQKIAALGFQICEALEIYLDVHSGSITEQMHTPISQLRLLHYVDPGPNSKRAVNMGAHTDYECLTLLHTANEGLQIATLGGKWIDVPVHLDAFVVNIGDMLEAFSNGIFRSTLHRVVNHQPERFSLPYFVATNYDTIIRPMPELIGNKPTQFEHYSFKAGEHLENMLLRDFPYLRKKPENSSECKNQNSTLNYSNPFEKKRMEHE